MSRHFTITLIGSGNVASWLGKTLSGAGAQIRQVYSREISNAKKLARGLHGTAINDLSKIEDNVDFIIIAVKDDAIVSVAKQLNVKNAIVLHTAGSVTMQALEKFPEHGVLYPVQTISKSLAVDPADVPLCLEASDATTMKKLKRLAKLLHGKNYLLNSEQRRRAHLAAVFANNFTNHLYAVAGDLLEQQQLPFELLRPLIAETARKVQRLSPADAQTGPALRNDKAVMKKHLDLLKNEPQLKALYKLFSAGILEKKTGSLRRRTR